MKIHPVGAELFHVDGRTDMTKLIVALLNAASAPKNVVTRYVLIFRTVFPITLSVHFILRVMSVILVQNQHFLIVSNVFVGLTAVSSDYITSWITFRAPVAWMYTKQLNHAERRAMLELITTLLQTAVL
jgi:hypothetical protein